VAETGWAQREWTIQHVLSLKLFLKLPNHMANDGTFVQVACLRNFSRYSRNVDIIFFYGEEWIAQMTVVL